MRAVTLSLSFILCLSNGGGITRAADGAIHVGPHVKVAPVESKAHGPVVSRAICSLYSLQRIRSYGSQMKFV